MSEILTDAIRYWELRRIPYNVVLSSMVIVLFLMSWPGSVDRVTVNLVELLFVLTVLANVAYCGAYLVEFAVQSSAFRSAWKRYRWIVFVIGVLFASIFARFFAAKMFAYAAKPVLNRTGL
jgi:hypothetical protein